ncbi:MAG: DUF6249 domain-containing protein [Verrucomicrobia bacterium]|nr:DUF6249 domain-containing protein [Verrucomicrobiota bacterium]
MKMLRTILLCSVLSLAALPSPAAETNSAADTNTAAADSKKQKKVELAIDFDSGSTLPREVLEKLSPDQIVELEKARRSHTDLESVIVPIAFFGCVIGIVAVVVSFRFKKQRMLHETVRTMIEKGVAIPPELLQPHEAPKRPRSDLRRGLVFAAIGLALLIWTATDHDIPLAAGLIPLLMGVAFLATWKIEGNKNGQN